MLLNATSKCCVGLGQEGRRGHAAKVMGQVGFSEMPLSKMLTNP